MLKLVKEEIAVSYQRVLLDTALVKRYTASLVCMLLVSLCVCMCVWVCCCGVVVFWGGGEYRCCVPWTEYTVYLIKVPITVFKVKGGKVRRCSTELAAFIHCDPSPKSSELIDVSGPQC